MNDLDFDAGTITIREKKRDRSREMKFRTVPMADVLGRVLRAWLDENHPGGPFTLCGQGGSPFTRQMMTKAFRSAVKGSRWQVVQGYHVLRHSFASNCAMKGVDQRDIDSWMGHQTEAMRRRYRHLFESQQDDEEPGTTEVAGFDRLTRPERLALLAQVAKGLHDTGEPCADLTTLSEAAVAAIFAQVRYLVSVEIDGQRSGFGAFSRDRAGRPRERVLAAVRQVGPVRKADLPKASSTDY